MPERTSVVGKLAGTTAHPSLMLFAQADTVPASRADGWERTPFNAIVEDERLYGWGVADDLVCVASMIFCGRKHTGCWFTP